MSEAVMEVSAEVKDLLDKVQALPSEDRTELMLQLVAGSTVLWVADLVKAIEDRFGVSAAAPVMAAMGSAAPAGPVEDEKTEFDVVLLEAGANKIQVIKLVRAHTDLGLKEAKALVDQAPKPVKSALSKEEAENLAKEFAEAGAKVEVK